mmetsp:Transcript_66976/g.75009  ORF Transcript_66976/g.75009 Transcript_66976/m.75009 type:complete len:598 (-) Transcript_66976:23-1816(-)
MGLFGISSNKKSKPTFGIEVESPIVNSGDVLKGKVWANIPSELTGTRMQVDFYGKEETKVSYEESEWYTDSNGDRKTRSRTEEAYSTRDIFRISLPMQRVLSFSSNGKIQPGQYVIPFSVVLPAFLPSTMDFHARGGYARIKYKIKMALKGSGVFWDYTAETPIHINSASIARHVPFDGPPDEQIVNLCCCFGRGSILVGAKVDNTTLAKGQQTVVSYACRNKSRNDVRDIYAELKEVATWSAGSHSERATKMLHSVRFPIQNKDTLKGMKDREMTQNDLEGYQYAGLVHEIHNRVNSAIIVVPNTSNNTYRGSLIKIRHELSLRVETEGCCTSNPELIVPIFACDVMKQQQQVVPIMAAPAIPFQSNSAEVIMTEPMICTAEEYVYGGLAQNYGKEGEGDDIPIADVAVAIPVGAAAAATVATELPPSPSLHRLLSKMREAGIGDRDVVMNLYGKNNLSWDVFFSHLSPQDFASIINQTSSSFDESDIAVFLASEKMKGTFTCDHIAAAALKTEEWNRTNLIEKLIPYASDFKQNKGNILQVLSGWDRCKAEGGFQEYLNSMANTSQPKKYIPNEKISGAVKLNPAYRQWMKENGN